MVYTLSIALSFVFLIAVIDLVRRQKLKEQYSLLWMFFSILLLIFSINVRLIKYLAFLLDIQYAPALIFLFGLLFCFTLILHLTIIISKLTDRVLKLSQSIAIMEQERKDNE